MAFANENLFEFDSVVDVNVVFRCDCDEAAVAVHRNFIWDVGEWELGSLAAPCAEAIRGVLHLLSIRVGEVLVNSITPVFVELCTRITRHCEYQYMEKIEIMLLKAAYISNLCRTVA
jgi:hypothetical protein